MTIQNRISATIDDASLTQIQGAIATLNQKLDFLVDLSPEEIKALPKFGDRSLAFVKKCQELAVKQDDFLPRNFDVDEFTRDVVLYEKMVGILQPMRMLMERMEDTNILVGSEAYSAALAVYSAAKNARGAVVGLDDLLDDFGKRFARKVPGTENTETKKPENSGN